MWEVGRPPMFEFLVKLMSDGRRDRAAANVFYPVAEDEIVRAEARLGRAFPPQLRAFFREVGCGFFTSASNQTPRPLLYYINRFLAPAQVAALALGEDEELAPSEGFGEGK